MVQEEGAISSSETYQKNHQMMDRCAYQQQNNNNNSNDCNNNGVWLSGGEMMNDVVCPRPRRVDRLNLYVNDSIISRSSPRWQQYYAIDGSDLCDSEAGTHLLDLIFTKECFVAADRASNPFFCGSPPSRASNPLIQDARFANENPWPLSTGFEVSPSSSARARVKFGQMPAPVTVEGFNRRGISTFA
ncbi:hypothetical protein Ccrd_008860 [Cynara cardunculus var. scolymus]|uniref:Uncharacterized protein n=1 Tax=Cynara cardunculus var. scolymus TaxID=59895 RepID=A0A118JT46_CYNCS|nr:hypothetical protein Ccrd_008860 [Cynara cardunculus var. scolymus]